MNVQIQKAAATPLGRVVAGAIIDIPEDIAEEWCRTGLAIECTSIEPSENAMLSKPVRRKANGVKNKNRTNNRASKSSRG